MPIAKPPRRAFGLVLPPEGFSAPEPAFLLSSPSSVLSRIPRAVTNRPLYGRPLNQLTIGSCVLQALVKAAYAVGRRIDGTPGADYLGSPQGAYQIVRERRGVPMVDMGCTFSEAIPVVQEGLMPYGAWPNGESTFHKDVIPNALTDEGRKHRVLGCIPIRRDEATIRLYISMGWPVLFGIRVFSNFDSSEAWFSGVVEVPGAHHTPRGGHAMVAVGYRFVNGKLYYEVLNSWGEEYGDDGFLLIAADYLHGFLCTDAQVMFGVRHAA